eukprot:4505556-Prymnesium_polylepis.1
MAMQAKVQPVRLLGSGGSLTSSLPRGTLRETDVTGNGRYVGQRPGARVDSGGRWPMLSPEAVSGTTRAL